MSFLKRLWSAAPIATVILALALVASLFFAVRTTADWVYWSDPAHRDQTLKPWMTPGYIAHSWDIPRPVMFELMTGVLDLPEGKPGRPMSLHKIAETRGVSVEDLIADIEAAIAAHRAAHPTEDAQ